MPFNPASTTGIEHNNIARVLPYEPKRPQVIGGTTIDKRNKKLRYNTGLARPRGPSD
jgi:hypothetical protein